MFRRLYMGKIDIGTWRELYAEKYLEQPFWDGPTPRMSEPQN